MGDFGWNDPGEESFLVCQENGETMGQGILRKRVILGKWAATALPQMDFYAILSTLRSTFDQISQRTHEKSLPPPLEKIRTAWLAPCLCQFHQVAYRNAEAHAFRSSKLRGICIEEVCWGQSKIVQVHWPDSLWVSLQGASLPRPVQLCWQARQRIILL